MMLRASMAGMKATDLLLLFLFILDQDGIKDNLREIRTSLNKMNL